MITCQALSLLRRLGVGGQSGQMAVALPFHIDGYLRYVFGLVPTHWFVVGKMVQDFLVIGSTAFLMLTGYSHFKVLSCSIPLYGW